ncbi:MAG TPA: alpha/beta hydrolase [Bacillota bacterium]|nr:alpha/beta hydrolase [Bacillota bacterium]
MEHSNKSNSTLQPQMLSFESKDGAKLNYSKLGHGPGLVILPGANCSSQNYRSLAERLGAHYTVCVIDRRGRNGSAPQGVDYSMQKECEDAMALLANTKSAFLFGHSYGGVIALNVARQYPLTKGAVYEPPVGEVPIEWLSDFEQALEKKDFISAQVILMKGLRLGGLLNWVPKPLLTRMFRSLKEDELADMTKNLTTVPREVREVQKLESKSDQYAQIKVEMLLLAGSKSPAYLRQATHILEMILAHSKKQVFPGLDHLAPMDVPGKIALALQEFFR